jgi:hypothetical protein
MKNNRIWQLLIIAIAGGTIFAWYQVVNGFSSFYGIYGTIFRIKDCTFPNPVTTPCFYGAIGFIVALIWAVKIYQSKDHHLNQFLYFLIACNIFGFSNVAVEFYKFNKATSGAIQGCSGLITNPWQSPCLKGSIFYLASLIILLVYNFTRKKH